MKLTAATYRFLHHGYQKSRLSWSGIRKVMMIHCMLNHAIETHLKPHSVCFVRKRKLVWTLKTFASSVQLPPMFSFNISVLQILQYHMQLLQDSICWFVVVVMIITLRIKIRKSQNLLVVSHWNNNDRTPLLNFNFLLFLFFSFRNAYRARLIHTDTRTHTTNKKRD